MAAEKKAERAEKVKMSIDGQERFRNWAERLWPGRRWLAIVLLPAIPVMAAALLTGDREISWGQLVATFYVLFLLAAICSRDFAARYIISSGAGRCLWRICWDRETAKGNGDDVNGGQFWRYGGMAMKTEKANLLEFCGSAVLFLAGVEEKGVRRTLPLKCNQVLLDESFIHQGQIKKLCGKRRFTLAHECAHQILYQMESDEVKQSCNRQYSAQTAYSLRDLKTHEDWNEWQANVLGATILMPQKEIDLAAWYFIPEKKLTSYGGYFTYRDRLSLKAICAQLGVSQSAVIIRLRQLGYLEDRPYSEFDDPTEVWA